MGDIYYTDSIGPSFDENLPIYIRVVGEMMRLPYKIRNVLIIVNLEDLASQQFSAGNIIWQPDSMDPRSLPLQTKLKLLTNFMTIIGVSLRDIQDNSQKILEWMVNSKNESR